MPLRSSSHLSPGFCEDRSCYIARSEDMAQLLKARLTSRNIELVTLVTGIMKDYRTVSVVVNPTGRVNLE